MRSPPLAVLSRGYALVYHQEEAAEALLRSAGDAEAGQTIRVRLAQGSLRATITETQQATTTTQKTRETQNP